MGSFINLPNDWSCPNIAVFTMKIMAVNKKSSLPNSSGAKFLANKLKLIKLKKMFKIFAVEYSPEPFANEESILSCAIYDFFWSNPIN